MSQPANVDPKDNREDYAFGELCIREDVCTLDQIKECLDVQARLRAIGIEPMRLGDLLLQKGYVTAEQAEKIARLQSQHPLRSGKLTIPGYEILHKIGQGAMGAVYRARQISMDRIVALKVLAPKFARDDKYVERFKNEARAVAKLNHENVISGFDVGEAGGVHFFVMEYVDGTTVARILQQQGRIDEKRCLQIALQIGRALDHANRHGILHRDVKPENIMITADGVAKLCDLGLAKRTASEGSETAQGLCVGTPNYISPEQARGEQNLDVRTDIYSLGAALYHMCTGRTPFQGVSPVDVMTKHVTEAPEPPRKVNDALSEGFNNLILRMMQKHRLERYQTPSELIADIEKLLRGEGTPAAVRPGRIARPTTRRYTITRQGRGARFGQPVVLVLILIAMVVVGLVLVLAKGQP